MRDEARVGDDYSKVINKSEELFIENGFGDIFEGSVNYSDGRPVDVATLLYLKVDKSKPEGSTFNVWWNHINDLITVVVRKDEEEHEITIGNPGLLDRRTLVDYIDRVVLLAVNLEN